MLNQILMYFALIQGHLGTAIAILFIIQPVTIPLSSMFHALEVQARTRGWSRTQSVAYWLAKAFGTFAAIDLRNIQRVGGKVFVVLAQVIADLNERSALVQRAQRITEAMQNSSSQPDTETKALPPKDSK
jgi:hypothetical protein